MCPGCWRERRPSRRQEPGEQKMPRRGEGFLLLEQAVTVDPNEIDALVAKIGETLQLQRVPGGGAAKQQQQQQQQPMQVIHHQQPPPYEQQPAPRGPAKCGFYCIDRLKAPSRNKPYQVPARIRDPASSSSSSSAGNGKGRMARPGSEASAQQKLEQLLSSGNLIKEAVRRLRIDRPYSSLYVEKIPM
ncbi:glycogen synthase kinase binding protein [Hypanus sabinus]|uniref:glycogen synthase kinase binding protein n=1 Tax=Hypanus sabinus TaxID=79690 RepID=UPI0028C46CE5|nr:glycogen synthase kinase binding protein [Hypanus sabinus]